MGKPYEPNYKRIKEIYIKEIIFEKSSDSTDVTIFGYYDKPNEDYLFRVDYWCEFSLLIDLLLFANEEGEPVIRAITDRLIESDTEIPTIIDVETILGRLLKIENLLLTIYKPMQEDENGELKESELEEFYIVESVEGLEKYEKDDATAENLRNTLSDHFILLESAYRYSLLSD